MKILIIHQYFNTPESGGPLRSFYLAQGLAAHGYQVEVITAHNHKQPCIKEMGGFKVHYLPVFYDNKLGFWLRILAFVKFACSAYLKALQLSSVDLCYAISTPLTVGWIARQLKIRKGIPYYFEVGDLWPDAPVQMGVLKNPWLIRKLKRFEKQVYQDADRIVALSPNIKSSIAQTAPQSLISVIPNMSDCQFFQMESKDKHLEEHYSLTGKLVVTYFGAAGRANKLEFLLEAANIAQLKNPDLHFLIVASGSELGRIKSMAARMQLGNLDFLPYGSKSSLRKVLNVTDAVYVSYADVPILATGSPNKYFDGLASGKLMLVNFGGWLKEVTEKNHLGFYIDPKRPQDLSDLLQPMTGNRAHLLKYQRNSRKTAELYFSKELAIQMLLKALDNEHQMRVRGAEVYTLTA